DDPLPAAYLFGDEILEQTSAHRARCVSSAALALACHLGGHEVECVQLRMGVLERGTRLPPLVDDQLNVGAVRVCLHALAPNLHRPRQALWRKLREREDR